MPADGSLSEVSTLGRPRMSRADERGHARALSPKVAWPTLALAAALPTLFITVGALGLARLVPLWICTPALALISYAHYTLVHEAIHGNVVVEPKRLAWINVLVGWIGAIGLGIGWPLLQRTHVLHHSHTNTENDPDITVKGTLGQLVRKWLIGTVTGLAPYSVMQVFSREADRELKSIMSQREIHATSLVTALTLGLLVLSVVTGRVMDWLCLWFVPQQLAVLILMVFFQWLPHHPFDRFDRYGATRISLWPGAEFLTLQQNLHLMHHLWPSVPFYNYRRLFRALRPVLEAEGSRIEGLRPRSTAPSN